MKNSKEKLNKLSKFQIDRTCGTPEEQERKLHAVLKTSEYSNFQDNNYSLKNYDNLAQN